MIYLTQRVALLITVVGSDVVIIWHYSSILEER